MPAKKKVAKKVTLEIVLPHKKSKVYISTVDKHVNMQLGTQVDTCISNISNIGYKTVVTRRFVHPSVGKCSK